jgi:hypothetical protein
VTVAKEVRDISYGLSKSALNLLKSYLSNRKQCAKIEQSVNEMLDIYKLKLRGAH